MDGFLLVDKPAGISSFRIVSQIRRVLSQKSGNKVKVGHTGTLDPAATGLMILVVGSYTKRASEFSKMDKTYEAEVSLGSISSTGDSEGEIVPKSTRRPSDSEIESTLNKFVGETQQTPPAFSAVKVSGQRAYKLARAGQKVELKPRKVTIYSLENIEYNYPKLKFTVCVSSGTYIRSLAQDIGKQLDTGAYLSALRRTKVGQFDIKDTLELDKIQTSLESSLQKLP